MLTQAGVVVDHQFLLGHGESVDAIKTPRRRYRQVDFWASDGPASHHCTCYSTTEGYVKDESLKGLVCAIEREADD